VTSPAKEITQIVPQGTLIRVPPEKLKPNPNNPRALFDPAPLAELKSSIREHGVLVPLTVYKLPGQDLYSIIDGERRYRCCVELKAEGIDLEVPANVVAPPTRLASLIYMFNIHSFREQWELMPLALSLKQIIEELKTGDDDKELQQITGLSLPQINRCRTILSFPEKFQQLSLDPDPKTRIPSNFWIELYPVLETAEKVLPDVVTTFGRQGVIEKLIEKYRSGKIKSVIHFRRIMEAFEVAEDEEDRLAVTDKLREYILTPKLETREAFDPFIRDSKRAQRAIGACERFVGEIRKAKVDYALENKQDLIAKLVEVIEFAEALIEKLKGEDAPPTDDDNGEIAP